MNFKEIYKSANEKICGDRRLIEKVIEKAEKKPLFKTMYPLACAVAALLIIVSVSVYPKKTLENVPHTNVASNKESEKNDIVNESEIKDTVDYPAKDENLQKEIKAEAKKEASTVLNTTENNKPENTEDKAEQVNESKETIDNLQSNNNTMLVMLNVNEIQSVLPTQVSYARLIDDAASSDENIEYEGMTAEQYYEYLGTNIIQKTVLPEGMQFEEFFGTTLKRDSVTKNTLSDNAEFYATGENKYISLSASKLLGDVQNKLDDETLKKCDIFGIPAVIEKHETIHRIYVKYDDICYSIYSEGLTLEEIEKLLISICKD